MCFALCANVNSPPRAYAPLVEDVHRCVHEPLGDSPVPEVRTHGERAEHADAAPMGHEVRCHQLPVELVTDGGGGVGQPTRPHVVGVPEGHRWVGQSEKRAEGPPEYQVGGG